MEIPNQILTGSELEDTKHRFIVYFLYDDEDQSVHVEEADEIDLTKVTQHLDLGGSVFIALRRNPESLGTLDVEEELIDNQPVT